MEQITLQKGVFNPAEIAEAHSNGYADEPQHPLGTNPWQEVSATNVLADQDCVPGGSATVDEPVASGPSAKPLYGYRKDSPPEILDLLHQAQEGDRDAFAGLYRCHVARITGYVAVRMRSESRDAIPDVVQDAFCEAFADLPNAHHDVTGWLLVHAAKAYIRYVRSERKQQRAVNGSREAVRREYAYGHNWQPNGDGVAAIGHLMLVHGLARLTPQQRTTLQHRYLEGQTQATTASLMDRSISTVRSNEYRALARLRAEFSHPERAQQ